MLPPVFKTLTADAAVVALVADRIFRHGSAPQGTPVPYITWQLVGGLPENNLSELPPFARMAIQVDCWHTDDDGVETLARAVRNAIEPVACMTGIPVDDRDPETLNYRIALQFDWFVGRSA
jgi:hypothetical protein